MAILIIETTDPDFWPCPEGCGGATEDEAGGPCRRCWDRIDADAGPRPWSELFPGLTAKRPRSFAKRSAEGAHINEGDQQ